MDEIEKHLRRQSRATQEMLLAVMRDILRGRLDGYDIRKITGKKYLYRLRKGDFRIIFEIRDGSYGIVRLARRDDTTYDNI